MRAGAPGFELQDAFHEFNVPCTEAGRSSLLKSALISAVRVETKGKPCGLCKAAQA